LRLSALPQIVLSALAVPAAARTFTGGGAALAFGTGLAPCVLPWNARNHVVTDPALRGNVLSLRQVEP